MQAAEKTLAAVPKSEAEAKDSWTKGKAANEARAKPLAGMPRHAQVYAGDPNGDAAAKKAFDTSRRNFLALVFCLMVGTAALPHILMRYYTTPSVKQARESVSWSLFFIFLLYFTAPALAVLVKYEVFSVLVGTPFDKLPAWILNWQRVDPTLLSVVDVNGDGIFQLGEMRIGGDIIVLATPEIGGLPYVISGLVAAGGLAAALSTADGLLLTIANALEPRPVLQDDRPERVDGTSCHDLQSLAARGGLGGGGGGGAETGRHPVPRVSGVLVRGGGVLPGAGAGHLLETRQQVGCVAGHRARPGHDVLLHGHDATLDARHLRRDQPDRRNIWWGIQPISAGLFGVPVGFAVIIIVSLLTPAPGRATQELVEHVRYPDLRLAKT